jgi:hypothetical protein
MSYNITLEFLHSRDSLHESGATARQVMHLLILSSHGRGEETEKTKQDCQKRAHRQAGIWNSTSKMVYIVEKILKIFTIQSKL